MLPWILALALALALWFVAIAYLWLVRRKQTEIAHGLAALAGMRWREFSRIVRLALADQRNLRDTAAEITDDHGTSSDFMMAGDKGLFLVSCKHGRAYRFGAQDINELASAMRLTEADNGILITEGRVERDGLAAATRQSIEVLDERNLWQLLGAYVPAQTRDTVTGIAHREAVRHTGIAALAALTLGLLAGMTYGTLQDTNAGDTSSPTTQHPAGPPAPPAAAVAAPLDSGNVADPTAGMAAEDLQQDPDPETLLRYQQNVSKALARTPGVISGIWLTRLTLSIERTADDATVWPLICREVERYPALRTVRIQLNPRPGSDEPVRWRQCSTI